MDIISRPINDSELYELSTQALKDVISATPELSENQKNMILDIIIRSNKGKIRRHSLPENTTVEDKNIIQNIFNKTTKLFAKLLCDRGTKAHIMPSHLATEDQLLNLDLMRAGLMDLDKDSRAKVCKIALFMSRCDQDDRILFLPPKLDAFSRKKSISDFLDRLYSLTEESDDIILYLDGEVSQPELEKKNPPKNPVTTEMYEELMFGVD